MIIFYSGAATLLLAGAVIIAIHRRRADDQSIEALISRMRKLSPAGQIALDKVNGVRDAAEPIELSDEDVRTILYNSRLWLRLANRCRQSQMDDAELQAMFEILQEDCSATETIVGRLTHGCIPTYARLLLWTYGEELELLSQISDKCGLTEGNAIQAIL